MKMPKMPKIPQWGWVLLVVAALWFVFLREGVDATLTPPKPKPTAPAPTVVAPTATA